ncbi:hypothetical protein MBLNU459_g7702t2 [Dothideomycetes sp. NU459]
MSITVYPPFGTNTSSEKDGLILLATILNIAISILALPFTVLRKGKVFGWSDAAACGAVTLNLVETIPLLLSRSHGLGTSSSLLVTSQTQNAQMHSSQYFIIWQNAHLGWAALSAAAPSMLWMRSSFELTQINEEGRGLPSIFGNGGGSSGARTDYAIDSDVADTRRGRCSKKATSNSSIQLRRLGGRKSILKSAREEDNVGVIRADGSDYNAQVQAVPRGHRASIGSGESEMNLIVVDVSRSVTHQTIVK